MIKIRIHHLEFTLNGEVWSGEKQDIADIFTRQAAMRPFRFEPRPEMANALYILEKNKDRDIEIIYDSEEGKPPPKQMSYYD